MRLFLSNKIVEVLSKTRRLLKLIYTLFCQRTFIMRVYVVLVTDWLKYYQHANKNL